LATAFGGLSRWHFSAIVYAILIVGIASNLEKKVGPLFTVLRGETGFASLSCSHADLLR